MPRRERGTSFTTGCAGSPRDSGRRRRAAGARPPLMVGPYGGLHWLCPPAGKPWIRRWMRRPLWRAHRPDGGRGAGTAGSSSPRANVQDPATLPPRTRRSPGSNAAGNGDCGLLDGWSLGSLARTAPTSRDLGHGALLCGPRRRFLAIEHAVPRAFRRNRRVCFVYRPPLNGAGDRRARIGIPLVRLPRHRALVR